LNQLNSLGDNQGSRYETLARLYGHIFLVQDSPRLPARAQATLLGAVQALVAGEPLAPPLKTLRAQLTQFRRATRPTGTGNDAAPPRTAAAETGTVAQSRGVQSSASPAEQAAGKVSQPDRAEPVAPPALPGGTPPVTAQTTTSAEPARTTGRFMGDLRSPLLIVAGLLALAALVRSLRPSQSRRTPLRDTALALLLLPAVAEGLLTLTATLGTLVKLPLVTPLLTEVAGYSLFTSPVSQLLWALIVMLASYLAVGAGGFTPAAQPSAPTPALPVQPLLASTGLDWDEEF
jgi:hypothetical protein